MPSKLFFGVYQCSKCGDLYKMEQFAMKHKCIFGQQLEGFKKYTIEVSPIDNTVDKNIKIEFKNGSAITSYES